MRSMRPILILVVLLLAAGACSQQPQPASSDTPSGTPATSAAAPPPAGQAAAPAGSTPAANSPVGQPAATPVVPQPPPPGQAGASARGNSLAPGGAAAPAAPLVPAAPAAPAPPRTFTLDADQPIKVRTAAAISTKTAKAGDTFRGELVEAITDGNWTIAADGAEVTGIVRQSDPGGRVKGKASLTVSLQGLQLADGSIADLRTSSYTAVAKSGAKKDAAKIGIGAAAGAGVGAIIGGKKGAGVGALVGGGGATGVTLATRGAPAVIRSGAVITFRLKEPVTVTKR